MKKQYPDDDGRTIADMSGVDNRTVLSGVFTGLALDRRMNAAKTRKKASLNKDERRMYAFGAMGAGLVIALIFLAGFAIAIIVILLLAGRL